MSVPDILTSIEKFYFVRIGSFSQILSHITDSWSLSNFLMKAVKSDCFVIKDCFLSSSLVYTLVGFNNYNRHEYSKSYSDNDLICVNYVRDIRLGNLVLALLIQLALLYILSAVTRSRFKLCIIV